MEDILRLSDQKIAIKQITQMQDSKQTESFFRELIRCYGATVNKVCYMYAENAEDFEDLRQEAFINLWRGSDRFKGDSDITTWIYRVTLNSCVSYFRKHRKLKDTVPLDSLTELTDSEGDDTERLAEVHRLINRLDKIEKALILLWLDDHPYEVIAAIMGLPRNTVASRIHRIKEKLVKYSNR